MKELDRSLRFEGTAEELATVWDHWTRGRWTFDHSFDREGRSYYVFFARTEQEGPSLTDRERSVACRVGRGDSNKCVAIELLVAESTVASLLRVVLRKLGVSSRIELVRLYTITVASTLTE